MERSVEQLRLSIALVRSAPTAPAITEAVTEAEEKFAATRVAAQQRDYVEAHLLFAAAQINIELAKVRADVARVRLALRSLEHVVGSTPPTAEPAR